MKRSHLVRIPTTLLLAGGMSIAVAACGDDSGGTTNDQPATSVMQEHTTDSMTDDHTTDSMMDDHTTEAMEEDTTATTTP